MTNVEELSKVVNGLTTGGGAALYIGCMCIGGNPQVNINQHFSASGVTTTTTNGPTEPSAVAPTPMDTSNIEQTTASQGQPIGALVEQAASVDASTLMPAMAAGVVPAKSSTDDGTSRLTQPVAQTASATRIPMDVSNKTQNMAIPSTVEPKSTSQDSAIGTVLEHVNSVEDSIASSTTTTGNLAVPPSAPTTILNQTGAQAMATTATSVDTATHRVVAPPVIPNEVQTDTKPKATLQDSRKMRCSSEPRTLSGGQFIPSLVAPTAPEIAKTVNGPIKHQNDGKQSIKVQNEVQSEKTKSSPTATTAKLSAATQDLRPIPPIPSPTANSQNSPKTIKVSKPAAPSSESSVKSLPSIVAPIMPAAAEAIESMVGPTVASGSIQVNIKNGEKQMQSLKRQNEDLSEKSKVTPTAKPTAKTTKPSTDTQDMLPIQPIVSTTANSQEENQITQQNEEAEEAIPLKKQKLADLPEREEPNTDQPSDPTPRSPSPDQSFFDSIVDPQESSTDDETLAPVNPKNLLRTPMSSPREILDLESLTVQIVNLMKRHPQKLQTMIDDPSILKVLAVLVRAKGNSVEINVLKVAKKLYEAYLENRDFGNDLMKAYKLLKKACQENQDSQSQAIQTSQENQEKEEGGDRRWSSRLKEKADKRVKQLNYAESSESDEGEAGDKEDEKQKNDEAAKKMRRQLAAKPENNTRSVELPKMKMCKNDPANILIKLHTKELNHSFIQWLKKFATKKEEKIVLGEKDGWMVITQKNKDRFVEFLENPNAENMDIDQ